MTFDPTVVQVLAGLLNFALAVSTSPRALIGALATHRTPILLAACGQIMVMPVVLFYYLSFIAEPDVAVTMITLAAIPAIGLVAYFAFIAGGSVPVALWSTMVSVFVAAFLAPGLLPLWLIAAPEVADAAPSIHFNSVPIVEALIFMQIVPMTAGYVVRVGAPALAAKIAPNVAHAMALSIVVYPVISLPITNAYMASSWDTHLSIVILYAIVASLSALYIMALNCDRPSRIAMTFLIPSKLTIMPMTAHYIAAETVVIDQSILMTWTALQFLFGVAATAFFWLQARSFASSEISLPSETLIQRR